MEIGPAFDQVDSPEVSPGDQPCLPAEFDQEISSCYRNTFFAVADPWDRALHSGKFFRAHSKRQIILIHKHTAQPVKLQIDNLVIQPIPRRNSQVPLGVRLEIEICDPAGIACRVPADIELVEIRVVETVFYRNVQDIAFPWIRQGRILYSYRRVGFPGQPELRFFPPPAVDNPPLAVPVFVEAVPPGTL